MSEFDNIFGLAKAGGPFIGPRGGKWADAAHTIPWDDGSHGDKVREIHDAEKRGDLEGAMRHAQGFVLHADDGDMPLAMHHLERVRKKHHEALPADEKTRREAETADWKQRVSEVKDLKKGGEFGNIFGLAKGGYDLGAATEEGPSLHSLLSLLVQARDLAQRCHWNVTGPNFMQLHRLFAEQYRELGALVDEVAERIRQKGGWVDFSADPAPDARPSLRRPNEMVSELARSREQLGSWCESYLRSRPECDAATTDLLTRHAAYHAKGAWFLNATEQPAWPLAEEDATDCVDAKPHDLASLFGAIFKGGSVDLATSDREFASLFGLPMAKGKKAVMGEVRTWRGGQFKKTPDGWVPVKGGRRPGAEEHVSSEREKKTHESEPRREGEKPKLSDRAKGQFYDVNPKAPPGAVAEGARVGIPGKVGMTKSVPRLPRLTPDERKIETTFAKLFEQHPDELADKFYEASKKDFVFETDNAKSLMHEWSRPDLPPDAKGAPVHPERAQVRALYNTALHQTANAIAKRAFIKRLDEIAKLPDHQKKILVTCGGVAAGKGSALGARPDLAASVAATWDAAGEQNATENPWLLDECKKRGIKATFLFVHADAQKAWPGVVNRAKGIGRMVDARLFADSYGEGGKNVKAFYDANKDDPHAEFVFAKFAAHDPAAVGKAIEAEKAKAGDNAERKAQLDKAAADLAASPEKAQMIAMGAKVNVPAEITPGMPDDALKIDSDNLYDWCNQHIDSVRESVPDYIYKGATAGRRIWKSKA